jgi:hypothetical protein
MFKLEFLRQIYWDEEESTIMGTRYNIFNLCYAYFNVDFAELIITEVENLAKNCNLSLPESKRDGYVTEVCLESVLHLCGPQFWTGFHLIAQHVNNFLQGCSEQSERSEKVQKLWQFLKKHGVNPNAFDGPEEYRGSYAIESFISSNNPHKTIIKLFFEELSLQPQRNQAQWIRNQFMIKHSDTLAEKVVWKLMTGVENGKLMWELLKPYADLFIHGSYDVTNYIDPIPSWIPESTIQSRPELVHYSDARKETILCLVVRRSRCVRKRDIIHFVDNVFEHDNVSENWFDNVFACVNALIQAGADKFLTDSNGNTAADLAERFSELQLRDLLTPAPPQLPPWERLPP